LTIRCVLFCPLDDRSSRDQPSNTRGTFLLQGCRRLLPTGPAIFSNGCVPIQFSKSEIRLRTRPVFHSGFVSTGSGEIPAGRSGVNRFEDVLIESRLGRCFAGHRHAQATPGCARATVSGATRCRLAVRRRSPPRPLGRGCRVPVARSVSRTFARAHIPLRANARPRAAFKRSPNAHVKRDSAGTRT
jgi:hypothetical protein